MFSPEKTYKHIITDSLIICVQHKRLAIFAFEAKRTGIARNYKIWRDDNHAICLESTQWIMQRLHYIHENPVKQQIVERAEHCIFSSAIDYADGKGLVVIERV